MVEEIVRLKVAQCPLSEIPQAPMGGQLTEYKADHLDLAI
jgi:hypothetical protein